MARGQGSCRAARHATARARASSPSGPVTLTPLSATTAAELRAWFDEEACAHLGDPSLLDMALAEPNRAAFVGWWDGKAVGLLIVEAQDDNGSFVNVREGAGATGYVSVLVAPQARGQGIGAALLAIAQHNPRFAHLQRLVGGVDADNLASQTICERSGFVRDGFVTSGDEYELRYLWQR